MVDKSHLLEPRYIEQIRIAETHLKLKSRAKKGTSIQKDRVAYLVKVGAECPICGITFKAGNHNTEHIFPSGLGGVNQLHNKIQMCVQCNSARAQILQLMGHPPWNKIYPSKFGFVKQILMWCLITIEDGNDAGKQIPHIHDEFMKIRTGGEDFPNKPRRAFGPASTWAIGDSPNYLYNQSSLISPKSPSTESFNWRSMVRNTLDKFFGYEPKVEAQSSVKITENTEHPIPPEDVLKPLPENKRLKEIPEGVDRAGFTEAITIIISGDKEITVMSIGNRIRKMQENDGWDEVGTRSFLQRYGFSRNFGLLNALKGTFEDRIIVKGTKSEQRIQIVGIQAKDAQSEPGPEIEPDGKTDPFPLISNFNSGSSGLRLPRHPKQLIECIVAYENKQSEIHTTADITKLFKQILMKVG